MENRNMLSKKPTNKKNKPVIAPLRFVRRLFLSLFGLPNDENKIKVIFRRSGLEERSVGSRITAASAWLVKAMQNKTKKREMGVNYGRRGR